MESLAVLDGIRLNFSQGSLLILNIALAVIMFGVALEIKISHFRKVITNPKSAVVGFVSQFLVLPALTFLVTILLGSLITPTIAMGMILVAACPGGNISNFMSALAKGNTALSVSLTAIATLSAVFMTPLNFSFWGGLYNKFISRNDASALLRTLEIDTFQVFQTVFILLGIPLIIGMIVNHKFPGFAQKLIKPIRIFGVVFFLALVILAFSNNFGYFVKYIHLIFFIVLIHNALALGAGFTMGTVFRLPRIDRRSVSIETGIQNSGLGLVLIFNPKIFPPEMAIGGMAFIAAWWGIWHILSGLGIAYFWSRKPLPEIQQPHEA